MKLEKAIILISFIMSCFVFTTHLYAESDHDAISIQEWEDQELIRQIDSIVPDNYNLTITYSKIENAEGVSEEQDSQIRVHLEKTTDLNAFELEALEEDSDIMESEALSRGIGARTSCYLFDTSPGSCSNPGGRVIGRAWLRTGTRSLACKKAKQAANNLAPMGCRAKHCSPCTYY